MPKSNITVYKFYSKKWALDAIQKRRLKVSELSSLNDPFEFLGANLRDKDFRVAVRKMKTQLAKTRGIISFSENWENPVIWSHYADSHKGIALGFSIPQKLLSKVVYEAERIAVPKIDSIDERFMKNLIRTKFKHWSYENEFRMWLDLSSCVRDGGFYFQESFEHVKLKNIVLGAQYETDGQLDLEMQLKKEGVSIVSSRLEFGKFKVCEQGNKSLRKHL